MSAAVEIEPADPSTLDAGRPGWRETFSSLRTRNYRLFATGQLFSNTGSWTQRIAQDWLVLSLTGSATAVGITTALQFLPTLLFGLFGGLLADRYPKRRILLCTQVGIASCAATLAYLTLSHQVQVWQVWVIAFALGTVIAVDNPTRQSFVNEMVGPDQVRNAVSLNSSVFQLGGLIGPAISGVLINLIGPGYSFTVNAVSYIAPMIALSLIRESELFRPPQGKRQQSGAVRDGLRYVLDRPNILWPTVLIGVFGLFIMNLPVTLSAYAKNVFDSGAGGYGLLSSIVAIGSLSGALLSARRSFRRLRSIFTIAGVLCALYVLAALAPNELTYCALMVPVGASTLLMMTSINSTIQLAAHDAIRGRVMGIYLLVFIGSGSIGGPLLGVIDQFLGPRAGMLVAGIVPAFATVLIARKLARLGHLTLRVRPLGGHGRLLAVVPAERMAG